MLVTEVCSLYYRPPEILLGQKLYSWSIDIWSLGCTFGEMIQRKPFLGGDCEIGQLFKIFQFTGTPTNVEWSDIEKLPDYKPLFPRFKKPNYIETLKEFLQVEIDILVQMLTLDPRKRPSAEQLLEHQYFKMNFPSE